MNRGSQSRHAPRPVSSHRRDRRRRHGEVYQATDPDLKRDVAIKVLPATLASDPERLTRFQREAEILASLNHPNIAIIYGLEKADSVRAIVME